MNQPQRSAPSPSATRLPTRLGALPAALLLIGLPLAGCGAATDEAIDAAHHAEDAGAALDDAASPSPVERPDLRASGAPYPFVLVHGMCGFKNIGPLDYFYGVADALRKDGHDVWVSQQDPLNDSTVRGEELRKFVDMVLASTGKSKVNLIGHSQGGFDVRYVASLDGDHVASVTTIASPMGGDPIADIADKDIPGPVQDALGFIADLYGKAQGYDSNVVAQIGLLSTKGARAFFAAHPDDPRVAYYSIAGRSAKAKGDLDCATPTPVPWISKYDQVVDPLNPLLAVPGAILDSLDPAPTHDGLVPVGSARHGRFLGCIPADHLDEVGQIAGQSPGAGNTFDHLQLYRDLAGWLRAQGH